MPLIELRDIRKTYLLGEVPVHALRGVTLRIDKGEFIAIMGASGSGKSTLMNILGCLDTPTSGEYILSDRNVAHLSGDELARIRNGRIGFVFQGFNLLARTSALENVELPMLYGGIPAKERHSRAGEALRLVGLEGRERHQPHQLSGGQQQRVAIARGLVNGAPLILADEPTGNLDSATSEEIMALFQNLNDEKGITVILVTHEPDMALYARRIVTVRDGLIVSDEPVGKRKVS
ncbi:ABC transporter ATP-binding protein [Aminithiophilus ramosus]|uniref:ABC transporter ATP-binding protein n=2 Tax=Synergistales TaxID=649776 RepID=A0A9Q7AEK4_9BACT|nr:ABC transporter ATP-binding protein [Aminithiophilus ramosus]QTX31864.1 ABC transporter ATP-binding protein [Aminithiophilus ramosus]QVL35702.1 ABC transporter ATP-binding protein [Synergistota bacterium]